MATPRTARSAKQSMFSDSLEVFQRHGPIKTLPAPLAILVHINACKS
jgi:hypothetical protein